MEKQEEIRGQVLVIPIPVQGHMNPMIQFSKRLVTRCKGLKVTLVAAFIDPEIVLNMMQPPHDHHEEEEAEAGVAPSKSNYITLHTIPFEPSEDGTDPTTSVGTYFTHFQKVVSLRLAQLLQRQQFTCVIYDSLMPWALDVAKQQGLFAACFFTQSNAVNAIYYNVHEGLLKVPLVDPLVPLVGLPPLEVTDLPSFVYDSLSYPSSLGHAVAQFSNFRRADCIFVNTFDSLEEEVAKWMASQEEWPVIRNIGPTIPSVYLDKRLKDDKDYGVCFFKAEVETCRKWLDTKEKDSVVYVSLGSLAALREEQMQELAWGLKRSNRHFLWVVREEEFKKLPPDFLKETVDKGLIVKWCRQLEVLGHRGVGCFLTHCGWNSTLEALSLGVPMVAIPQWTDQTTNAKFVMDVWRVGIRVEVDSNGFFTRQEVEKCIRDVMEGDRGLEIKTNSSKWMKLAIQAVDEGGTSDNNIQQFVQQLASTIRNI
ncbi:UDP-glycosyltransferase 74E2 [Ziziphus jujuba]|uniref:Glycosyltransferase n=1 Tax=Ziziphus jujuba TaxID=326968 RepID=A0ABM3ZX63_ZIZJJ|nr:UDP-glycosyltransferase 74E2 [Ziziphus jujuba]